MPTALSVISTANDIAALLPVTNGTVNIGPDTLPGSFLSDILNTFNNGQPLQISTSTIPAVLSNGVTVSGTTPFFGATSVQLSATFYVSGDFTLTATLPDLTLTQLTSKVSALQLPNGMANADLGEAQITAGHTGGVSSFTAVGGSPTLGEFAFSAQQSGSTWGAAFGFEINVQGICNVPALKNTALANFDSFLGLQNFLMVLSSFDSPGFTFPDLVSFDASGLVPCGKIALPGSGGVKAGLNLFASLGGGSATGAVTKLIHGFNLGSLSTALSVSLPDPLTSSQLYLNLANIAIRKGVLLNGSFGGRLQASSVGVYFLGTVQAPIQHQQVTFTAQAIAAPTGFMLSGSMQTTAGLNFDVGNTKFSISDLGFVIGVDDDGLPSLGFAATFDIGTAEGSAEVSAAVFIDSVNPSQSVFAAAVSSFTLYDIAFRIAGQSRDELTGMQTILNSFALKGTQNFNLSGDVATALNTQDLAAIAKAFKTSAQIMLPSTYDKVQVHVNTAGSRWYVTDLTTQLHYSLNASTDGSIAVQLEPQFYFAGQDTNIGALTFPKGFFVSGELDLFLLKATVDVEVVSTGLMVEVDVTPVTLGGANFFALTGAGGAGGPRVSIATMVQPQLTDPILSQPHVLISGEVKVLGIDLSSTYFIASGSGVAFALTMTASPWLTVNLTGSIGNSAPFSLGGTVTLGLNDTFDLGALGSISLPSFSATLSMGYSNNIASAHLAIHFTLGSWTISFGQDLDVNVGAFASSDGLKTLLHTPMFNALEAQVKADATQWLAAVQQGLITASQDINSVANVLQSQFNKGAQDISNILASANYSADQIYNKVLKTLSPANADAILRQTAGLGQDQVNLALSYGAKGLQAASSTLSGIESAVQNAGNTVVNWLDKTLGISTESTNADAALNNALNDASLLQPALSMRHFNFLAPTRRSWANDLFMLGIGTDKLPYLVTWMHARGQGWKGGRMLPYPPVGLSLASISLANSHAGDSEVLGLATDGTPYIVAFMPAQTYSQVLDRRQGWLPGIAMPCPEGQNKFIAMAHTLDSGGNLQIAGLGKDNKPYIISYLPPGAGWQPGILLPCPAAQNQFTSINITTSQDNVVHVLGIGIDSLPYHIASLNQGVWKAGEPLPCPPAQGHYKNLITVTSATLNCWVFGLGIDGLPYLLASVGTGGLFYASKALPVPQGSVYSSLEAVGFLSNGDLQVLCLGMDHQLYVASYLPANTANFVPGTQLPHPPQQTQFRSISTVLANTGDAEVSGLGVDQVPYIAAFFNTAHGWQPGACMNITATPNLGWVPSLQ